MDTQLPFGHEKPTNSSSATQEPLNALVRVDRLGWKTDGKTILKDISFQLHEHTFTGIIGPNGAGKSSLLRCLYKEITASEGDIFFQKHNIAKRTLREHARDIAVILQESHIPFGLSVFDVVAMGLIAQKPLLSFLSSADKIIVKKALDDVGMKSFVDADFNRLSGGEKQRVLVARAIVQKPKLLLMDEPTNHLDIHYQREILELAKQLGITVLASIHDLNLASAFCDQILLIDQGQLLTRGTPNEVFTEDRISQVFKTCALVDRHPLYDCPRISYAYLNSTAAVKSKRSDLSSHYR